MHAQLETLLHQLGVGAAETNNHVLTSSAFQVQHGGATPGFEKPSVDSGLLLAASSNMMKAAMMPQFQSSGMDVGPAATALLAQMAAQIASHADAGPKASSSFSKAGMPANPPSTLVQSSDASGLEEAAQVTPQGDSTQQVSNGFSKAGMPTKPSPVSMQLSDVNSVVEAEAAKPAAGAAAAQPVPESASRAPPRNEALAAVLERIGANAIVQTPYGRGQMKALKNCEQRQLAVIEFETAGWMSCALDRAAEFQVVGKANPAKRAQARQQLTPEQQPAADSSTSSSGPRRSAANSQASEAGTLVGERLLGEWRHVDSIVTISIVSGSLVMFSTDAAQDSLHLFAAGSGKEWEAKASPSSQAVYTLSLKEDDALVMSKKGSAEPLSLHRVAKSRTIAGAWESGGKRIEVSESEGRYVLAADGEERSLVRRRVTEWEARTLSGKSLTDSAYLVDHVEGSSSITLRQLDSQAGVENVIHFTRCKGAVEAARSLTRSVTRSPSRERSGTKVANESKTSDLSEFVQKNGLTKRTEMALKELSSKEQRRVMGLDGGKHAFLLNGKVRDPDAVVMSRIKRLESEPVQASVSPPPRTRQRERSRTNSRSRNGSRSRSRSRSRRRSRSKHRRRRNAAKETERRGKRRRRHGRRADSRRRKRRLEEEKRAKKRGRRRRDKKKTRKAASDYSSDYSSSRSSSYSDAGNSKGVPGGKEEPSSNRQPEQWQADLENFVKLNGLAQRTQSLLRELSREYAMCVMGTDGGQNGFELKDRVRDPDAVVISRIKKLQQNGLPPAPAPGPLNSQVGPPMLPPVMPGLPPTMPSALMPPTMPHPPMGMPMVMPGMLPMMPGMTMPMQMHQSSAAPRAPPVVTAPADITDNGIDYDDL